VDHFFPIDELAARVAQRREVRICRTVDCGQDTLDGDVFCQKCRDEIDAARELARRHFVIYGVSGKDRRPS